MCIYWLKALSCHLINVINNVVIFSLLLPWYVNGVINKATAWPERGRKREKGPGDVDPKISAEYYLHVSPLCNFTANFSFFLFWCITTLNQNPENPTEIYVTNEFSYSYDSLLWKRSLYFWHTKNTYRQWGELRGLQSHRVRSPTSSSSWITAGTPV